VPWSYATKGIMNPLPGDFVRALKKAKLAVYCHELWLGLCVGASLRHRWWGYRQREAMLRFFRALRPDAMMTSNAAYAAVLERYFCKTEVVPLPSNLEVHAFGGIMSWIEIMKILNIGEPQLPREKIFLGVTFGTVTEDWAPEEDLERLLASTEAAGKRFFFVSLGKNHQPGRRRLETLAGRFVGRIEFFYVGEQPTSVISLFLGHADFGMPTTDPLFLGKSGSAAAMRTHGLPMLMPPKKLRLRVSEYFGAFASEKLPVGPLLDPNAVREPVREGFDDIGKIAAQMVRFLLNSQRGGGAR